MIDKVKQCTVRDDRLLEPCWALSEGVHGPASKKAGLHIRRLTNLKTMQPSRTYAVARHEGRDIVLNHCPWCGAQINQMFDEKDEVAADAALEE